MDVITVAVSKARLHRRAITRIDRFNSVVGHIHLVAGVAKHSKRLPAMINQHFFANQSGD